MLNQPFDRAKVFRHKDSIEDAGSVVFDFEDVEWLLAFLDRFRQRDWLPPRTAQQREALRLNDLMCHTSGGTTFFEFRVRGGRDDRVPTLTLFIHVDPAPGVVRVLANFRTDQAVGARRSELLELVAARSASVDTMLARAKARHEQQQS